MWMRNGRETDWEYSEGTNEVRKEEKEISGEKG